MKQPIIERLEQIEKNYYVKILFACEAGSRAWGLNSDSSDYDVRFIYIHPPEVYLSIDPIGTKNNRDVIDVQEHVELDIHGWEITKALRLLRKSNPSLLEWLHSPIVYYINSSSTERMKRLLPKILNQKACMIHYVNMAKNNLQQLQRKNPEIKTVINIIRPILIAKWLEKTNQFPPMDFIQLCETLVTDGEIQNELHTLIHQKVTTNYNHHVNHFDKLLRYAESELIHLEATIQQLKNPTGKQVTEKLNRLFRNALDEFEM
ncbi:nucleotidyltransferase domain-containing protein [Ornithinibacillus halotolerans]|uniref:Nucleotidyltransferase domain-containing protein n=1 Tax=Ornithinibacillus halotolerans TaxID=1274357 RepID=A0A916WA56_9BACI|nr:nucleotidyltransferase domain-containing protein [Ornithinibacillus halotolerans]GGA81705.1 hypothetical protein GCM10008025_26250 [Ornithinibacillus halotolerans]